ncbi:hypothetical protein NQ318_009647 [Aromia moschata]|uniref:Uncharacterized protein n=1 Tax=Aromia moschata TaxID=1265417 RepID=A0AAV8XZD2_9CUCU|nr:hypothetical protein NQ318_009647 [Aromia moschata]
MEVVNIVENLSSQEFDKEELNLLNKGLKFGLPASGGALEKVVAGVECAIQHLPDSSRGKETATLRYIPNDSHHPFQHNMAS